MRLHLMQYKHAIEPRARLYTLRTEPLGPGSLTKRGGVIDGAVMVPRHSLGILYQALTAGRTLYALLVAPPLRYGSAVATSLHISTVYPE